MQYFCQYPDAVGPDLDMLAAGSVAELARAAESAGFNGFALTEHPAPGARWLAAGGHQTLDPFVALASAAAVTERLQLLTYLAVLPYRNPLLLAKSAATVDIVSGGRFILGVGTGYLKGEFRALGVDFDDRNARFDEALEVMPLHWSGEPFDYEGVTVNARGVQARPAAVQQPIPIWIGGNARITRRRVAERAQGWMPLGGSAELLKTTRTPSVGSNESLASLIAEVKEMAGERGSGLAFVHAYIDSGLKADPTAEADRHREAFAQLASLGITHIVTSPPSAPAPAAQDWIAAFGETYLS